MNDDKTTDGSNLNQNSYEWFQNNIFSLTKIDLNNYKRAQMERRIQHLMGKVGVETYNDYFQLLNKEAERLKEFTDWVTINVSEFFRDFDRFEVLANKILPALLKNQKLRIWSAGCSNGSEPYSVSIILSEMGLSNYSIIATDIDDNALIAAKKGEYTENDLKKLPTQYLDKYFNVSNGVNDEKIFTINSELKKNIVFKKHNMLYDQFENGFNLIICRNVVIYFTSEAKNLLYEKFSNSLAPSGIFFVGSTESLLNCKSFGLQREEIAFYKKI